jgi:hypothetical protein
MDPVQREFRAEAAELERLPLRDVKEVISMCRQVAADTRLPRQERDEERRRVEALEKFLGLAPPPGSPGRESKRTTGSKGSHRTPLPDAGTARRRR